MHWNLRNVYHYPLRICTHTSWISARILWIRFKKNIRFAFAYILARMLPREKVVSGENCLWRKLFREKIVSGESCLWRKLSRKKVVSWESRLGRKLFREKIVSGESCLGRKLPREKVVSGESCLWRKLSREKIVFGESCLLEKVVLGEKFMCADGTFENWLLEIEKNSSKKVTVRVNLCEKLPSISKKNSYRYCKETFLQPKNKKFLDFPTLSGKEK